MFVKQNQKHKKICFIFLLTVIPPSPQKGNANGAGFKSKARNYVELGLLNYS